MTEQPNAEESASPTSDLRVHETAVIKALTHPARSRLIDLLGVYGPATVGHLAERTGLAAGSVSHHLSVLAEAGLITEDDTRGGDRRQRWWRRAADSLSWNSHEMDEASGRILAEAAEVQSLDRQHDLTLQWLAERDARPEWIGAAFAMQSRLWLTPAEAEEVAAELRAVIERHHHSVDPEHRDGRDPVILFARAFPSEP